MNTSPITITKASELHGIPDSERLCVEVDHPLVRHKISLVRDENTDTRDFRALINELATLVCYEATKSLQTTEKKIRTPLEETTGSVVGGKKIGVVPILRAGLGMLDGIMDLIPVARVGFIGLYRDEETMQPHAYFEKLPPDLSERDTFLLDPMLATGGSVCAAVRTVKEQGARKISLLSIIAAPEGIARVHEEHPDVSIYVAQVDERLDENCYIRPGLGDAGDRLYGTR